MLRQAAKALAPRLARGYAGEAGAAPPFAVQAFANQQAKFRALVEGSEKIAVPHDDAGFTKFASDYAALKAKVNCIPAAVTAKELLHYAHMLYTE